MNYQKKFGAWGENVALDYLLNLDYLLIEKNYHTRYGEIDIVVLKDNIIYFIEVKTRSSDEFGLPEDSISNTKREKLLSSALLFLEEHPELPEDWQFDLITVEGKYQSDQPAITHFINAVVE
ncbi:MAG: YraN family protein [Anaerolineaceae bacterium]|nr:YraN family protein [Anaerolineaceae bacterium]